MKKILPFCLLMIVLTILSEIGRTNVPGSPAVSTQFVLQKSFTVPAGAENLLASVYSTGEGPRKKEVLSVWSREDYGYELQYIKTAAAGENFLKPSILEIQGLRFMNVLISGNSASKAVTVATLWIAPDTTLHEVTSQHARALLKIDSSRQ